MVGALTQKRRDDQKKFHHMSDASTKLQQQQGLGRKTAEENCKHDGKEYVEGRNATWS